MVSASRQDLDTKIREQVRAIPPGKVSTYGRIADLAGMPRGARRVGLALRSLPAGSDVPWHRVINAQGRISFPRGSDAWREQRARLLDEGIVFHKDKVDLKSHQWEGSLDELLWGPPDS